jgi:hypothetical protein
VLRDASDHWPAELLDANLTRTAMCVNACRLLSNEELAGSIFVNLGVKQQIFGMPPDATP